MPLLRTPPGLGGRAWPRVPSTVRAESAGGLTLPLVRPPGAPRHQRSPRPLVSSPPALPLRDRAALALQKAIGRITVLVYVPLVVFLLRWVMGYRWHDVESVRRRFLEIRKHHPGPLLVCPNHLTMIDSAIIAWGLASPLRYVVHYRLLPWNLPEQTNFAHPVVRLLCYLAKCLPIRRGGGRGPQRAVFRKCARLLRSGHPVLVFPEGRRSRTGRIDPHAMAHGLGRLVQAVPDSRVLCVYLRGDGQIRHSRLPRRGESFRMELRLIRPETPRGGVRASREISASILAELAAMEQAYLHARRE